VTAPPRPDESSPSDAYSAPDPGASIWREGAFVRLWTAATISYVGSFITRTALPLAAIIVLRAGPIELSLLRSLEFIAWLLMGLIAGAWVDRLRRRPIMVVSDLGRALLLGSIPLAAIAGVLTLAQLIVVAFFAAMLSTFFNSASTAYLPTIVARTRLIAANSALSASVSGAEFTGFALSGILVQVLTAPIAIAFDAISFVASALLLATIRRKEPPRPAVADREPMLHEIREGIRVVAGSPILRALAGAHAATHLLWGVFGAIYLLFATEEIGLAPAAIGIVVALGGLGSLLGATVAGRVARRVGIGRAMVLGLVGMTLGDALIPLAPAGAVVIGGAFLVVQQLVGDSTGTVYEVVEQSLTQSIVDGRILGRVNATVGFVTTLLALAGSILGGVIGEVFGLRAALAFGVLGSAVAVLFVWFSPVRSMRTIPEPAVPVVLGPDDLPQTE
jgi:MFS family permease